MGFIITTFTKLWVIVWALPFFILCGGLVGLVISQGFEGAVIGSAIGVLIALYVTHKV